MKSCMPSAVSSPSAVTKMTRLDVSIRNEIGMRECLSSVTCRHEPYKFLFGTILHLEEGPLRPNSLCGQGTIVCFGSRPTFLAGRQYARFTRNTGRPDDKSGIARGEVSLRGRSGRAGRRSDPSFIAKSRPANFSIIERQSNRMQLFAAANRCERWI